MPISCGSISARLEEVRELLSVSSDDMRQIKSVFLQEMRRGWEAGKGLGASPDKSSLKMLTSHVDVLPTGEESGTFYALDLGGTNLRVLRVLLRGAGWEPTISEHAKPIPHQLMTKSATAEQLFDFIAISAKELTEEHGDTKEMAAGFTFSFPVSQSRIDCGTLLQWTKGFETTGVVGQDPAGLLQEACRRHNVPLKITALCNDTVGTLMTCAYQFKGCTTCKLGVILGTGTNAAYADSELNGLIVNIEWGGFNKGVKITKFDDAVDSMSPNPGFQIFEKMISGMYLGELSRRAALYVLGDASPAALKTEDFFSTADVCNAVAGAPVPGIEGEAYDIVKACGEMVLDRSAALTACALVAVAHKTRVIGDNGILNRSCSRSDGMELTVGIDGSVYTKAHNYPARLKQQLERLLGTEAASFFQTVHSEDGSGVGAALIAAAVADKQRQ